MAKITTALLEERGACGEGIDEFLSRYPSGEVEVTNEEAHKHADDADWGWMAEELLSPANRRRYLEELDRFADEHHAKTRAINDEYRSRIEPLAAARRTVRGELLALITLVKDQATRDAISATLREYENRHYAQAGDAHRWLNEQRKPQDQAYYIGRAELFVRLFNEEHDPRVVITRGQLSTAGVCYDQLKRFDEAFPGGEARVTEEIAREHANLFDWMWAGHRLLKDGLANNVPCRVGCDKQMSNEDRAALFARHYIEDHSGTPAADRSTS